MATFPVYTCAVLENPQSRRRHLLSLAGCKVISAKSTWHSLLQGACGAGSEEFLQRKYSI